MTTEIDGVDAAEGSDAAQERITVGILDDHAVIVDGMSFWIGEHAPDIDVVLRATTWLDLVRDPRFPVDVVLMDLQLAESVSIESRIRACRAAGAEVVVVTALDDAASRMRSLAAGAAAFVPKTLPVAEVVDVLRRVAQGERTPVRPRSEAAAPAASATSKRSLPDAALSDAERRAVGLYAQGMSTSQVAARMDVGYETVKTYLRRAREKYARVGRPAGRRAELIRRAAEDGMFE